MPPIIESIHKSGLRLSLMAIIIVFIAGFVACEHAVDYEVNVPAGYPINPTPRQYDSDPTMQTILSWECFDQNDDIITYDIYFGLTLDPPLVKSNQPFNSYDPGWQNQKEAWDLLRIIYAAEKKYRENNNLYWGQGVVAFSNSQNSFSSIGIEIPSSARYTYCITTADAINLLLTATCSVLDNDPLIDAWTIDENDFIESVYNDFDNPPFIPDTTYYWRVVSRDSGGGEIPGSLWSFDTYYNNDSPCLMASANPVPVNGAQDQKIVLSLSWESPASGYTASYDVYLGANNSMHLAVADLSTPSFCPGPLERNKVYSWRVVVHAKNGPTIAGPVWSFRTTDNLPPYAPRYLYPENGGEEVETNIGLEWKCFDPDNGILSYDIYFGLSQNPPKVLSGTSVTTYYPKGMKDFSTYYWRVEAIDSYDNKTSGPVWSFSTVHNLPPAMPSNPTPSDGVDGQSNKTFLDWESSDPDGDSVFYDVYFGTSSNLQRIAVKLTDNRLNLGWKEQEEMKGILAFISSALESYYQENGVYIVLDTNASAENPDGFAPLGIRIPATSPYYYIIYSREKWYDIRTEANLDADNTIDRWEFITIYGLRYISSDIVPYKSNTIFYWKIVATDQRGNQTAGPVWTFKTGGE